LFVDTRTEREKMIAGQLYCAADPELVAARILARRVVHVYNATDPGAEEERRALLAGLFQHIGDEAIVEPPFHCDYGWNISMGAGVYVNVNCVILDCAPVTIGALTMLGPGVQLCAATHSVGPVERERGLEYALPVVIGANVWIAASVVVGPGATIGDNSVIGAGSVVLNDVPANVVAAGNPARIVRHL
jgi:maltose O-acetyltransferase